MSGSSGGNNAVPKVTPLTIGGPLSSHNRSAFDWSWQGPVAFGCQNFVVVVDPNTSQRLQTLVQHKSHVTKVRWGRQVYHCTLATPYTLRLASVDTTGHCIVWDVGMTTPIAEFSLGTRLFVDLQWLTTNDSCRDLLAVLLSPGTMTIWNADTGTRISRFTFTETITAFTFNPFQTEQLILLSQECFIFVNDFSPLRTPTGGGKKLYMSMPQNNGGVWGGNKVKDTRQLVSGDSQRSEDGLSLVDCLQIVFSPSNRHHLLLLYAREILTIDTEIMQAVGSVYLERSSSPFLQLVPCWQRDAIYCLHDNGCVSFRVHQHVDFPSTQLSSADFSQRHDEVYVLQCHSDALRISKSCHVYSMAVCPNTELQVALLTSDGKVMFLRTQFDDVSGDGRKRDQVTLLGSLPADTLASGGEKGKLTLHHSIAPYWFNPPDGVQYPLVSARLMMTGIYYGLFHSPTSLRMCPPLTTKNFGFYRALVAVGGANGVMQVYDLSTQQLYKEITVHTCPVRGVEWLSHNMLLTYAHPTANSSGQVRNELAATHLDTGNVLQLKRSETNYQAPITSIRVSQHRNYFFVNFKDSPPHFYDARTLSFIRELDAKPAVFVAMEWANASAFPSFAGKVRSQVSPAAVDGSTEGDGEPMLRIQENRTTGTQSLEKEVVTLVDSTANIHHLVMNKSGFELGPHKSVQSQLNSPTALTWKSEVLVIGDSEGSLMMWDVNKGSVKYVDTPRAVVKKLRFGPGKGNRRIIMLYSNRMEIRDVSEDALVGQLRWGRGDGELAVEEVDWCASDKPVCLMSDGSLRVFDMKLGSCVSSHGCSDYSEPVFCPHIVLPQAAFRLKSVLQHQVWNIEYSLDHTEVDSSMDPIEKAMSTLLLSLPIEYKRELLGTKLGTPYRSLITALLFGDEREVCFWFVALYHILREKQRRRDPRYLSYQYYGSVQDRSPGSDIIRPNTNASTNIDSAVRHSLEDLLNVEGDDGQPASDLSMQDLAAILEESNKRTWLLTPPIDLSFDFLCDQDVYKRFQLFRAMCHDNRRHKPSQTRKCGETMLLLGQTDRAVQLLLETDAGSTEYYADALKACLAATIRSSGASQSTIKLVATNLIAGSHLIEGVQLLCLIDKGIDACRYMQSYGEWTQSVWLARSTLNESEAVEVLSRWADHLASPNVNKKNLSILVLLSVGQFMKVIEALYSMRYFDQAAVFLESCLEYGLVKRSEETTPLIEAVFLEYARYLENLGLKRGMRYYCNLAGDKGQQLMEEYLSPHRRNK